MDLAPVLRSLRRWPAQIAGGPVDLSNLVLGLLAGKGTAGLSEEPIGGSAHLNRLTDNQTPGDPLLETALGFVDPAVLTKGLLAAATIPAALAVTKASAGAKGAKALSKQTGHIGPMTDRIEDILRMYYIDYDDMASSPVEAADVVRKTAEQLKQRGNPLDLLAVVPTPDAMNVMVRNRVTPFGQGLDAAWEAGALRSGDYGTAAEFFASTPMHELYGKDLLNKIKLRGERLGPLSGGYYAPSRKTATVNAYLPTTYGGSPAQLIGHEISHGLNDLVRPHNISSAGASTDPMALAQQLSFLAASPDFWSKKYAPQIPAMSQYMDRVAKATQRGKTITEKAGGNVHKIYANNWGEIMARHSERPLITDVLESADDATSIAWILRNLHKSSLTPAQGIAPW